MRQESCFLSFFLLLLSLSVSRSCSFSGAIAWLSGSSANNFSAGSSSYPPGMFAMCSGGDSSSMLLVGGESFSAFECVVYELLGESSPGTTSRNKPIDHSLLSQLLSPSFNQVHFGNCSMARPVLRRLLSTVQWEASPLITRSEEGTECQ
jgi:hypothetical protein